VAAKLHLPLAVAKQLLLVVARPSARSAAAVVNFVKPSVNAARSVTLAAVHRLPNLVVAVAVLHRKQLLLHPKAMPRPKVRFSF